MSRKRGTLNEDVIDTPKHEQARIIMRRKTRAWYALLTREQQVVHSAETNYRSSLRNAGYSPNQRKVLMVAWRLANPWPEGCGIKRAPGSGLPEGWESMGLNLGDDAPEERRTRTYRPTKLRGTGVRKPLDTTKVYYEGKARRVTTTQRVRNRQLVADAIEHHGRACMACLEDCIGMKPAVHHLEPICKGERHSTLDQVAVLCHNCHKRAEFKRPAERPRTLKEIKRMLEEQGIPTRPRRAKK